MEATAVLGGEGNLCPAVWKKGMQKDCFSNPREINERGLVDRKHKIKCKSGGAVYVPEVDSVIHNLTSHNELVLAYLCVCVCLFYHVYVAHLKQL